jgi:hypothetical protein
MREVWTETYRFKQKNREVLKVMRERSAKHNSIKSSYGNKHLVATTCEGKVKISTKGKSECDGSREKGH